MSDEPEQPDAVVLAFPQRSEPVEPEPGDLIVTTKPMPTGEGFDEWRAEEVADFLHHANLLDGAEEDRFREVATSLRLRIAEWFGDG